MPGYEEHRRLAEAAATLLAVGAGVFLWSLTDRPYLAVAAGSVAFVSITVGTQLPDVDSPTSVPRRRLTRLLQVFVSVGVVAGTVAYADVLRGVVERGLRGTTSAVPSTLVLAVGALATAVTAVAAVPRLLHRILPGHRGPFHDIRFWLVVIGGSVALVAVLNPALFERHAIRNLALLVAGAGGTLIGVGIHLALDRAHG